jgi:hypothetical protein
VRRYSSTLVVIKLSIIKCWELTDLCINSNLCILAGGVCHIEPVGCAQANAAKSAGMSAPATRVNARKQASLSKKNGSRREI